MLRLCPFQILESRFWLQVDVGTIDNDFHEDSEAQNREEADHQEGRQEDPIEAKGEAVEGRPLVLRQNRRDQCGQKKAL
jgi:hypothetical protein